MGVKSKLKARAAGDQPDTPPPDAEAAGTVSAAGDLMPGMQGAPAPGKIKQKISPFPPGRGGRGMGGRKAN